ncbi:MAG: 23S rRNA (uracil(1939)-C(5))-methyltransferase RlmD, partial [Stomatobaculum sp.]|nr:23S rRNA (uracil(1939)-C(5))-methyltransferase RlmD [Stomatobaculum sp.]
MEYRKNEVLEMEITDLGSEGEGIGRTGAFLWFVKDALPGDRIKASVMKVKKNYGYARLQEILIPGPDRIVPACPVARQCGGCTLQAMDYAAQLRFKENKVRNNLLRIGGIPEETLKEVFHPVIGMENPFRYRNKAQFPVGAGKEGSGRDRGKDSAARPVAGFYAGRTHSIIPCEDCLLGVAENKEITAEVLSWMEENQVPPYDEESGSGFVRHILIRKGFSSGEIMLCLVTNGEETGRQGKRGGEEKGSMSAAARRFMKLPGVTTVVQNINREKTNVILGKETRVLAGPGFITDKIGGIEFEISAQSFYQVNPVQTEKLYGTALRYAGLTGKETVWDLYCGIGTISLFMAKQAKKVYGDEIVPQAIEDARRNAARNGIKNAEFFVGKAEEVLPRWYGEQSRKPESERERIDVICVDPPRKGCDEQCLKTMLAMRPERIVYVSCDSATLARDLKYLLADGTYRLKEVQPVDMFPQTVHVETVALLSKLHEAKHHVNVKLDMDELDLTSAEAKATYKEIQEWVQERYGFHVTNLNIAQVK